MKRFQVFTALLAVSLTATAQNSKNQPVATVGNEKITLEEFNRQYKEVSEKSMNPPTKAQFLEDLVRREIGLQEAAKKGLDKHPAVQQMVKQAIYAGFLELELGQKVQNTPVNEKDMRAYYAKNPELRLSYILIELKSGASKEQRAEAKARADKIYAEVKASKRPFEELVKLYTDDSLTKNTGGDAGWQSRSTLVPTYYETLLTMKVGEIRGLVETPYGYHIVKLTGRRAYENANRRQIRMAVFDLKRKETFDAFFEKLKKNYTIKTNMKLIE